MKLDELILTEELCAHYQVEKRFIRALHEREIIHLERVEQKEYLPVEKIGEFEKLRRLHYEMHINMEGLEAVQNLLDKIKNLQREKQRLKNRLRLYE